MNDPRTLKKLQKQRAALKKKMEDIVRTGAGREEFSKIEEYLKMLDKRIGRDYPSGPAGHLP